VSRLVASPRSSRTAVGWWRFQFEFEFGDYGGDVVGLRQFDAEMPPQFNSDASYESFASLAAAYLDSTGCTFRLNSSNTCHTNHPICFNFLDTVSTRSDKLNGGDATYEAETAYRLIDRPRCAVAANYDPNRFLCYYAPTAGQAGNGTVRVSFRTSPAVSSSPSLLLAPKRRPPKKTSRKNLRLFVRPNRRRRTK